ncbi:MAG: MFS transporter [Rhizobiales bacterium]|nr:MFS transporter [Hyphomicrobiales bacterium]
MSQTLTYTKRERSFVTWSAILGYSFDFYNLIVLAFLLVPIQKTLHVTLAQTGLIVGLTLAASVLGGILFGWVGDKIGRKNALLWTLLLLAIGSIMSALAWDFASLLAFRILTGIGVGGEWGAGMVLLKAAAWCRPCPRSEPRWLRSSQPSRWPILTRKPLGGLRSGSAVCRCC